MSPSEKEIAELYRRLGPVVYRRALKLLQNRDDAADATQLIFIKLLKNAQKLRERPESTVPYLIEVTTNHCFNQLRDSKRRAQLLEGSGVFREEVSADLEQKTGDRQLARQVLKSVGGQGAEIAARVLVAEQEHQTVAAQLGVSEKTVQRKLKRFIESAKRLLRRQGS